MSAGAHKLSCSHAQSLTKNVLRWEVDSPADLQQPRMRIQVVWAEEYDKVLRENQRLQREVNAFLAAKGKASEPNKPILSSLEWQHLIKTKDDEIERLLTALRQVVGADTLEEAECIALRAQGTAHEPGASQTCVAETFETALNLIRPLLQQKIGQFEATQLLQSVRDEWHSLKSEGGQ